MQKSKKSLLASLASIALASMLLIGCAGGISSNAIPPLVKYDKEFQAKAADELDRLGDEFPHTTILVGDYSKLRDQIREAEK